MVKSLDKLTEEQIEGLIEREIDWMLRKERNVDGKERSPSGEKEDLGDYSLNKTEDMRI